MYCIHLDSICGDFTDLPHFTRPYKKLLFLILVFELLRSRLYLMPQDQDLGHKTKSFAFTSQDHKSESLDTLACITGQQKVDRHKSMSSGAEGMGR